MEEGGKLFTGIAFDASDNDTLDFYTKYEDGWEVENVHLYPSGRLKSYSKSTDLLWQMLRFMKYLLFYGFSKVKDLLRTSVV